MAKETEQQKHDREVDFENKVYQLTSNLAALLIKKNHDYGNSFHDVFSLV